MWILFFLMLDKLTVPVISFLMPWWAAELAVFVALSFLAVWLDGKEFVNR